MSASLRARICVVVFVVGVLPTAANAEEGDDTLEYYLLKSSLVVSGELATHPFAAGSALGAGHYSFKMKVAKVLKGALPAELPGDISPPGREVANRPKGELAPEFSVGITHPEVKGEDRLKWLKKGNRVTLFLRERDDVLGRFTGADPWFAIQPASDKMVKSLVRVAGGKDAEADGDGEADGDETLRQYIAKSSLIVSGRISGDPLPRAKGRSIYQHFTLQTEKVLMGDPQGEIEVDIAQPDKEPPAILQNNARVILFLTEAEDFIDSGGWVGADPWIGAQRYNSLMERAVERLAKD